MVGRQLSGERRVLAADPGPGAPAGTAGRRGTAACGVGGCGHAGVAGAGAPDERSDAGTGAAQVEVL
jgi:hypothetical protein